LLGAKRLLFATIDGHLDKFLILAFLRAFLLRPTCGIFVYPARCFERNNLADYTIRRWLLAVARVIPNLKVLSIIPYDLRPEFRLVTSNWIHDPQLWDLWTDVVRPNIPTTLLSQRISLASENRDVVVYLGQVKQNKGFRDLVNLAEKNRKSLLVAACGQVQAECRENAEELQRCGGIVEDRFLTDEELLSLFGVAKFAWCRYLEGRQASSGIFGRAVQTGLIPIIFEDSYVGEYARANKISYAVISKDELRSKASGELCESAGPLARIPDAKRGSYYDQRIRTMEIIKIALRIHPE
jgi:glycosyltransferase involved in cell wall biosynthesis